MEKGFSQSSPSANTKPKQLAKKSYTDPKEVFEEASSLGSAPKKLKKYLEKLDSEVCGCFEEGITLTRSKKSKEITRKISFTFILDRVLSALLALFLKSLM